MMMFRAWLVWSIWSQLSWSIMWAVFIHLVLALLTSSQVAVLVYHVGSLHSLGPGGPGNTQFLSGSCTSLPCG